HRLLRGRVQGRLGAAVGDVYTPRRGDHRPARPGAGRPEQPAAAAPADRDRRPDRLALDAAAPWNLLDFIPVLGLPVAAGLLRKPGGPGPSPLGLSSLRDGGPDSSGPPPLATRQGVAPAVSL